MGHMENDLHKAIELLERLIWVEETYDYGCRCRYICDECGNDRDIACYEHAEWCEFGQLLKKVKGE